MKFTLTPPLLRIKIFSLSTESRDWRPECYERLGKTVAQSGFFYSRKSENHTFKRYPQIGEPFQKVVNDGLIERSKDRRFLVTRYANLDQFITSNWRYL